MRYSVKTGESPAIIARRFGLPMSKLIGANPHKPATVVAGVRTWRSLHANEVLSIPVSGTVGDFLGVAPALRGGAHPLLKRFAGSDPSQVALAQTLLGITADGVFGQGTEAAVKAFQSRNGLYADGIVGPNTWAKLLGAPAPAPSSAPSPAPSAASASSASSSSLASAAARAAAALAADPGYCSSVRRSGTPVNSAVHSFKSAWNTANPSNRVPIGTGNYEPSVAAALSSVLGGAPVPPGCGATAAAPAPAASSPQIPTSVPTVTPATVPAAAQALSSVDPCYSGNAVMVCAAQAALGIPPDGKYGPGTAAALRRFLPNAPAPCSPTPLWWGHKTDNKCTGGVSPVSAPQVAAQAAQAANQAAQAAQDHAAQSPQAAAAAQVAAQAAQAATQAAQVAQAAPSDQAAAQAAQVAAQAAQTAQQAAQAAGAPVPGPSQPLVAVPGEKKGLSTGAMVAGALGAAALVGVVAVAATSKKKPGRHAGSRKSAHRKPTKRAKKRR